MTEHKKGSLAEALSKAAATRETDRKKFIETDQHLTARREGKVGIPPPPEADIGTWQKIQQDIGKQRGFLQEDRKGNWRYAGAEKDLAGRPAEKLATGKIKRKRYKSVTI